MNPTSPVPVEAPLLRVRDLRTRFHTGTGIVDAVRGVSFDVRRGESIAIVGESGSGKSVTAMSLMNMVREPGRIDGGSIEFDGRDVLTMNPAELRSLRGGQMSMIFQDPVASLDPLMRIRGQIVEAIRSHQGVTEDEAVENAARLMQQVGIPDPEARLADYPLAFSGGMSQRVMIAMALANNPSLLIADEPTTALDVTVQAQILDLIGRLNKEQGTAVILITHNLGVVAQLCQRVAVMYAGRIVEFGETDKIFRDPRHPYTRDLLDATPRLSGIHGRGLTSIAGRPPSLREPIFGCSYAARDPLAFEKCRMEDPWLEPDPSGRVHACWLTRDGRPLPPREPSGGSVAMGLPSTSGPPLLEAQNLVMQYKGAKRGPTGPRPVVRAVDDVTFSIGASETVGLVGESGCGKSTIARMVLGIESPTAGDINFEGKPAVHLSGRERRRYNRDVQIVFQNPMSALNPRMTVGSMLSEPLALRGIKGPERTAKRDELLELVGLDASISDRYPHEFSGGQRQRLVIARALAVEPKLIVCDEAVAALDVSLQAQIINLLRDLQERLELSYLFIGHDLATVRHVSQRILVMYLGQIVEQGSAEEVTERPLHPYTVSLLSAVPEPDPGERRRERIVLTGEVPTPLNPPSGCRFHTRCPIGPMFRADRDICREVRPVVDAADPHGVACHFAGELTLGSPSPDRSIATPI